MPIEHHTATLRRGESVEYLSKIPEGTSQGLPIVFIHGLGGDKSHWQEVMESEHLRNSPLFAVDYPVSESGESTISNIANRIGDFAHTRVPKGYVLVGHSFGANIAMKICDTELGAKASVLMDPTLDWRDESWVYRAMVWLAASENGTCRKLAKLIYPSEYRSARREVDRSFSSDVGEETKDRFTRTFLNQPYEKIIGLSISAREQTKDGGGYKKLNGIDKPTLIVRGYHDDIPKPDARKIAGGCIQIEPYEMDRLPGIANSDVLYTPIYNSGHCPMVEQPKETASVIASFVSKLK